MINPSAVGVARVSGRLTLPWVAACLMLFVLNYLFPAVQRDLEQWLWSASLSSREDSVLSTYVLDGALTWLGLTLSFTVSAGMYGLAFRELRDQLPTWRDLSAGLAFLGSFVPLAFTCALLEELLWALLSQRLLPIAAVTLRILIVWCSITPFIFAVPLMVDRRITVFQAMRESYQVVAREPLNALLLLLAAGFWANIGFIVFFVGVIFTLPTYHRAIARAYREVMGTKKGPETNASGPVVSL